MKLTVIQHTPSYRIDFVPGINLYCVIDKSVWKSVAAFDHVDEAKSWVAAHEAGTE